MTGLAVPLWAKKAIRAIRKAVGIDEGLSAWNDLVRITVISYSTRPGWRQGGGFECKASKAEIRRIHNRILDSGKVWWDKAADAAGSRRRSPHAKANHSTAEFWIGFGVGAGHTSAACPMSPETDRTKG